MDRPAPIYLDNAATTRVLPEIEEVVRACMEDDFGNPSSAHHVGITAEARIKTARDQLLEAIGDAGARAGDVYWTSGGTESDALGVIGAARARAGRGKHIVIGAIEHPAVRESAQMLGNDGWRLTEVPVSETGAMDPQRFIDAIEDDTTVAALMLVNNEIGTLMPVAQVAAQLSRSHPDVHLHCDAVQALGKVHLDVVDLGAASVAFAAHKLHGPKGAGALWLRKGARVTPLWSGGGQQAGVRSGTLNVPGIAGLGKAAEVAAAALDDTLARCAGFEAVLLEAADASGAVWRRNGGDAPRAPHVVSLAFDGIPAEPLLHVLESRGVLVSAGSACAERDRKPSRVLSAIALPESFGTVRLSFGRDTTKQQVQEAARILVEAVRSFS